MLHLEDTLRIRLTPKALDLEIAAVGLSLRRRDQVGVDDSPILSEGETALLTSDDPLSSISPRPSRA
jgi:hypothetical protein